MAGAPLIATLPRDAIVAVAAALGVAALIAAVGAWADAGGHGWIAAGYWRLVRAAAWDRFIAGSNCRAWLLRILTNSYINGYRRGRSHRKFAQRPGGEPVELLYGKERCAANADPERAMTEPLLGDEVSAALAELPEDYRLVVVLADLEGLKYKEVADAIGCPVGTVMSRLFRARRVLEERLAGYAASEYGVRRAA